MCKWKRAIVRNQLFASFRQLVSQSCCDHLWPPEDKVCAEGCRIEEQFSSVAQLCPTLWDPMNHSTPGLPVHHQLLESTKTHVHWEPIVRNQRFPSFRQLVNPRAAATICGHPRTKSVLKAAGWRDKKHQNALMGGVPGPLTCSLPYHRTCRYMRR